MQSIISNVPLVHDIAQRIQQEQGRAFVVGGAVRDFVLNLPIKDYDIEVHDLSLEALENILKGYGFVDYVGKAFGVLRLQNLDVDWSLPRTDSAGRKPTVTLNSSLSLQQAAARRDLTMNALAIDCLTGELFDPFNGIQDIKNKILRSPDITFFSDDPLRFFRVMQFIGRFEMVPDEQLNNACKTINITAVSRERVEQEFNKLFLYAKKPSLGIRWLHSIGRLREVLPELADTVGVEQNPKWHPEGDVFEHTMQAIDAAAKIAKMYDSNAKKLTLLYAALCHDLGKVTTSCIVNGVIKSIGHERESKRLAPLLMKRLTHHKDLIIMVQILVENHMAPLGFLSSGAKAAAYKRLAAKMGNRVSLHFLADLCLADRSGRNGESHEPFSGPDKDVNLFIENAQKYGVLHGPETPVLHGDDVMALGYTGAAIGRTLENAYKIQINEGIGDRHVLLARIAKK
jgi:tRNA nucleotidyltransferase (CCA-adding enzyme)